MTQSDEGKPTESAQQDGQRYERIMTVARHVQLSEDQVKRLLGCLLMVGLELTEVDPEAAPSTPVSAPQEFEEWWAGWHKRFFMGELWPEDPSEPYQKTAARDAWNASRAALSVESVGQEETKK